LSGRWRSGSQPAERCMPASSASSAMSAPWWVSYRSLTPCRIANASSGVGSLTHTGWKRRSRAVSCTASAPQGAKCTAGTHRSYDATTTCYSWGLVIGDTKYGSIPSGRHRITSTHLFKQIARQLLEHLHSFLPELLQVLIGSIVICPRSCTFHLHDNLFCLTSINR